MIECPTCGGRLAQLGQLGNRLHFRCINCGMDCSVIVTDDTVQDEAKRVEDAIHGEEEP